MAIKYCFKFLLFLCNWMYCILGMFAIRADRDYVVEEDFLKAARKIAENKKLEGKLDYEKI